MELMNDAQKPVITIYVKLQASIENVWKCFTEPEHIRKWNNASEDWHTPYAENDLRVGGRFLSRMEAKDGSFGFDFGGVYDDVKQYEKIAYTLGDGRKVTVTFRSSGSETEVIESFEAESTHSQEQQRMGWQSILDNYAKYTEGIYSKSLEH